jgi:hypothetical protein
MFSLRSNGLPCGAALGALAFQALATLAQTQAQVGQLPIALSLGCARRALSGRWPSRSGGAEREGGAEGATHDPVGDDEGDEAVASAGSAARQAAWSGEGASQMIAEIAN